MSESLKSLQWKRSTVHLSLVMVAFFLAAMLRPSYGAEPDITFSGALSEEKISPELLNQLRTPSTSSWSSEPMYKVIISLENEKPGEKSTSSMQEMQSTVINSVSELAPGFQELNRYKNIAGFSAQVNLNALAELVANDEVVYIEEMLVFEKQDAQAHAITNTEAAHALGATGAGVTIAIIDDGIQYDHQAFGGHGNFPNAKIIGGYDFADDDSDPGNDCNAQSHGTQVTGVAAGNGGGVVGTAPDAQVVFLKIQTSGTCGTQSLDGDVIGAIDWAVTNRATYNIKVISMSFGFGQFSSVCDNAFSSYTNVLAAAQSAGITAIAASGNDGYSSSLGLPSCISTVTSVGATYDANVGGRFFSHCSDTTTQARQVTCYSNSASFLDLLAPSDCATTSNTDGTVASCFAGTSSATPYAAGIVATLYGVNTALNDSDVIDIMKSTGEPVTDSKNNVSKPFVRHLSAIEVAAAEFKRVNPPVPVSPQHGSTVMANTPVNVSFQEVTGSTRYHVERYDRTIDTWSFSQFPQIDICTNGLCTLSVPGTGAQTGAIWRVRALNAAGWSDWSDWTYFNVEENDLLDPPSPISPAHGSTVLAIAPVDLSFQEVTGSTRYHVERYDRTTGTWSFRRYPQTDICANGVCSLTIPGTAAQTGAIWRVRALNDVGWSEWSSWIYFNVVGSL